tara:strand:+ start:48 stop:383 length:336 start_codon:yes stop_codon:yes gene_type:complete
MTKEDITTRGAVRTRYHGPTNCKGSRISATNGLKVTSFCTKKTIYQPYDHSLTEKENHYQAAQAFFDKAFLYRNDDTFIFKVDGSSGLVFGGDHFWTWDILEKKEEVVSTR